MRRCRLCTCNDRDALVDEMTAGAWEAAGYGGKWADVGATWTVLFRYHAELMLRVLERDHELDHGLSEAEGAAYSDGQSVGRAITKEYEDDLRPPPISKR